MAGKTRIFVNCAGSRTQREVMRALKARNAAFAAYGRSIDAQAMKALGASAVFRGGLLDVDAMADAMSGASVVIHVAPALQDKEVAMGQCAIDAARQAGISRFVYMSVIHPQIDYLMNHKAKLAVEDSLIGSGLPFTILRPMHYYQNIDVRAARETGRVQLTYSVDRPLGFVDMADVGEVAAKVATEDGHDYAAYDLCGPEHLTGIEIAATLSKLAGRTIQPVRLPLDRIVETLAPMLASGPDSVNWTASALERLFLYYDRFGIRGNANILEWLLGRAPNRFADYARRELL